MKKIIVIFGIFTFSLFLNQFILGQSLFIIKGKVVDWENSPVSEAIVLIPETGKSVETDDSGCFEIKMPPGKYHIEVHKKGYMRYSSEAFELKDKSLTFDVILMKELSQEIVVTATRTDVPILKVPIRTEVIPARKIIESGVKNMYELLEKRFIPGVWVETSCTNCNFSSVRMQGLESGYCGILFDGQPIFSTLASVYGLRQILPENIERIEVVKGASSALYGSSAIGGVINVITKEPTRGKPEFNVTATYGKYNTYDVGSSFSLRQGNVAAILTAQKHKNNYADETGPLGEPDNYTDKVEQDNNFLSLKTHFYFAEDKHRLTLFGRSLHAFRRGGYIPGGNPIEDDFGNIIGYTRGIDDALDPDAEHITTDRREYGVGYKGIFSAGNVLTLNAIVSSHERDATNGERPFHSNEDIFLFDSVYSHPFKKHVITTGLNYRDEKLDQRINWADSPQATMKTLGIFVQDEFNVGKSLDFIFGLRYDNVDSSLSKDSAFSPRLAVKWDIGSNMSLRGSVGAGFKVPYLFAEDLHLCSAAPLIVVSPDIEPEKAWSYNLSWTYSTARFTLDANAFRTDIQKKIALDFDEETNIGFYDNAGDAYTQGIEATIRIMLLRPSLDLSGSFTYTDAMFKEKLDPEYEYSDHIMRVPDITARLGLEYYERKTGLRFYFGGRFIGRQYVEREMIIERQDELEYHIDHVDSYSVWDAKITKDLWNGKYFIFLGVDNIFNKIQSPLYNAEQEDTAAYIYAPTTGTYIYSGIRMRF